jgi:hypothetical protein
MKTKLPNITLLGGILFLFFGIFGGLGISWGNSFISISLDRIITIGSLGGVLCSYMAVKKNKNPNTAFWMGLFFSPIAFLYYLISKPEMSEKEKDIHEWELEKKYKKMLKEKDQKMDE